MFEIGETYLVTTSEFFIAPDGLQYKGAFGTLKGVYDSEATLGVKTNAKSTNWYIQIGNMTIAGCQIYYAIKTRLCNLGKVTDMLPGNTFETAERMPLIYGADTE